MRARQLNDRRGMGTGTCGASPLMDEQRLALGFPSPLRRLHGMYFTPAPVVKAVLELAVSHLSPGPLTVVDPACGAGAFLTAAASLLPQAALRGLELSS